MTEPLLPGWSPKKPPPSGDSEPAPKPKRYWWRFLLAGVIIISVSAAATATGILVYVDSIAAELGHNDRLHNKLQSALAKNDPGEAQTILILGSDKRAGAEFEEDPGRSDTTILLRIDPSQDRIAVMSIPRDLEVEIPEVGTEKFNAAYSYGGPKLTLQVVKELTGLKINHVVNVDFLGFVRAVDAIGCVYTDVDRRYYHSNEGLSASEQYAEINIQPGYQLLCGKKALQYVRYRHTDTDIVRSARQQSFISNARHQVSLEDLLFPGKSDLVEIFTDYTNSDISSGAELLEVLKLAVAARNASIDQIHFPAELGPSYVYANEEAIHGAVKEFLGEGGEGGSKFPEQKSKKKSKKKGSKSKQGKSGKKQQQKKPIVESKPPGSDGLVPAAEAGEAEAKIVARKVGGGFPVFYATRLPSGASYVESDPYERIQDPRVYHLRDGNNEGERHPAYRMVGEYQPEYEVNYFGIQGIGGWEDPPILDNPSETRTIHGRDYEIFVDGDKVKLVAWHRGENTYWVSNSLQQSLTNDQMLGIARSAHVILPKRKHKAKNGGKSG
jgi:LCP family protein required for cell wall assembly